MLFDNLLSETDRAGAKPDDSLPASFDPASIPRRVAIVGAGMAGLVAGYELERAGHDVIVIEARKRVGGRIFTQRDADGGVVAEAGAGRIPTSHLWTNHYIAKMGLQTKPLISDGLRTLAHVDGHSWVDGQTTLPGFTDFSPDEIRMEFSGLVQHAFGTELARLRSMSRIERAVAFDAISVMDHLRHRGFSERVIALLTVGVFPRDITLGSLLEALEHLQAAVMHRVSGGNDLLPSSLAAALRRSVRLDSTITAITQTADRVELVLDASGKIERLVADAVLCTVPFSVIGDISFDPPLSEDKRQVIAQLHYAPATKVYLKMPRAYWEATGHSGFAKLDHAREIWAPRLGRREDGAVIQLYAQGPEALALDALDEAQRLSAASALVARIFPERVDRPISGASYSWQEDPWARGAYVVRTTATAGLYPERIGRREGRIYFAGEHVSEHPGWIEGAIRSGYAAAHAIHDADNGIIPPAEINLRSG